MAQKKLLFVLILALVFSTNTNAENSFEFKKEDMDFAKDLARRSRQMGMSAIKEKWLELQQMQSNSPIAFEEGDFNNLENPLAASTTLRVFVSSSMGTELLKHYVQMAKRYKAILVFNGLPDGSWRKLSDLVYEITGGEAEETALQLDDNAFKQYQILTVPSFVLSTQPSVFEMNNENDSDAGNTEKFDKVVGNIGIRRALEEIAAKGELSDQATELLDEVRG